MSLSPVSVNHADSSADINTGDIPWEYVERSLVDWLQTLRVATASGNPQQVLKVLEALVKFICCNDGSFLHTIVTGQSMEQGLRDRGAPETLIATFMAVIQCTGGMEGAILSFGNATSMPQQLAAELIASLQTAERLRASHGGRSTSPRRPNYLPQRTTTEMLDELWHEAASGPAPASTEALNDLQIVNLINAVAVPVDDMSPAVISGLQRADAVPFLIVRWLNACLVEVIFCIYHNDTTFVMKRRVMFISPALGTQLEGQLVLDTYGERLQLEGPSSLPWIDVAGLLAAPVDSAQ